jgi:hypothetical protein
LPNRVEQRKDDREHGIRKLSLPAFKFNWLSENGIFDRDRKKYVDEIAQRHFEEDRNECRVW